ncbi:MAG: hypothetical protein JSS02_30710 [Planctomycetes bacterium]|nr:hypothetical protein [Planctomycetota bacterium]
MICEHLRHLYQLCLDQKIRMGGSDLIHLFCEQCNQKEVCPSMLLDTSSDDTPTTQAGDASKRPESPATPA